MGSAFFIRYSLCWSKLAITPAVMIQKNLRTDTRRVTILIRIMVGAVFLSEGIQKFLYPAMRGPERFEGRGFFANLVGAFKILAGLLILLGLRTRAGVLITFIIMTVAISVTKILIAFGQSFDSFTLRKFSSYGFWSMAHEIRTDFAMGLGSLFLLIKGGGRWSLDRMLTRKLNAEHSENA